MSLDEEERKTLEENEELPPAFEGGEFTEEEGPITDETTGEGLSELNELEEAKKRNRRATLQSLKVRRTIEDHLEKKRVQKELGDIEDYFDDEEEKE